MWGRSHWSMAMLSTDKSLRSQRMTSNHFDKHFLRQRFRIRLIILAITGKILDTQVFQIVTVHKRVATFIFMCHGQQARHCKTLVEEANESASRRYSCVSESSYCHFGIDHHQPRVDRTRHILSMSFVPDKGNV